MKCLVMTSKVTYIPTNGRAFLTALLTSNQYDIAGLVLVNNVTPSLLGTIGWLFSQQCVGMASTMLVNYLHCWRDRRHALFSRYHLPVIEVADVNQPDFIHWVREQEIDVILHFRTRSRFSKALLQSPRLGCVNLHHGLLPTYRGLFCDLHAISENRPTGISLHNMTETLDGGDILEIQEVPPSFDYKTYLLGLWKTEGEMVARLLTKIRRHNILPQGIPNKSDAVVMCRNPTLLQIRRWQRQGMKL
jgi:methionyl-tRNA formyltransferase